MAKKVVTKEAEEINEAESVGHDQEPQAEAKEPEDAITEPAAETEPEADHAAEEAPVEIDPAAADKIASGVPYAEDKVRKAFGLLDKCYEFLRDKKEGQLNDMKIDRVRFHAIVEMGELRAKRKLTHLSDGSCEMITLMHEKLVKMQKIKP